MDFILSSPCSRSDLPLSRQGAALGHLDFLPLTICYSGLDGSVPFPFGKSGSRLIANCLFVALRPPFLAGPLCLSFSAEASAIPQALAGLGSTNNLLLLFSSYLAFVLSSPPCPLLDFFFVSNSLADVVGNFFSPLPFYEATMDPRTFVSPGKNAADELARRGSLLAHTAIV